MIPKAEMNGEWNEKAYCVIFKKPNGSYEKKITNVSKSESEKKIIVINK